MEQTTKNNLLNRVLNNDYIDKILGPAADNLVNELGEAYEHLGSMSNDPIFYRGKIAGLQRAFDILRQVAKNISKEEEED